MPTPARDPMSTSDPTASPTTSTWSAGSTRPTHPAQPARAVVALGSNLGNRLETLQGAVDALADTPGLRIKAVSPVYETAALGVGPGEQPDFSTRWSCCAPRCRRAPCWSGPTRSRTPSAGSATVRWGARTLDVDILSYEDVVSDDPVLTLPHPRAHERAFVLAPWHDADPAGRAAGPRPGRRAAGSWVARARRAGPVARTRSCACRSSRCLVRREATSSGEQGETR